MRFFGAGFGIGVLLIPVGWFFLNVMGDPAGFGMEVFNDTDETIRISPLIIVDGKEESDGEPQSVPPRRRRVLSAFERAQRGRYSLFRLEVSHGRQRTSVQLDRDRLMELDDFQASIVVADSEASFKSNAWILGRRTGAMVLPPDGASGGSVG